MDGRMDAQESGRGYGKNAQGDPEKLEIGAGNLNHLPYETVISNYDVVEPFKELLNSSPNIERIRTVYKDISDIEESRKYDRIISIACFEHLEDLPGVVEQASRLLSPKGQLRVAIPNEGTILWKLGTRLTGYKFKKKYGLYYQVLMRHEHLNSADEIEEVLRYYFSDIKCRVFGISRRMAFYRYYECNGINRINTNKKGGDRNSLLEIT